VVSAGGRSVAERCGWWEGFLSGIGVWLSTMMWSREGFSVSVALIEVRRGGVDLCGIVLGDRGGFELLGFPGMFFEVRRRFTVDQSRRVGECGGFWVQEGGGLCCARSCWG